MPKSKRDKKISLTKTDKKGLQLKQRIVEDVRACVEKYSSIYLFTFVNMRTNKMKFIREEWKGSRFFFGKNRVVGIGLGRTKEEEAEDGLHKLSDKLKGQCALLFTNCAKTEVLDWFSTFSYEDFARTGHTVNQTVELNEGPMPEFAHSIEPYLRQLGLPTKLERGVVTLLRDYVVCKEGSILTAEQAKILKLLGHKLAAFELKLKACWIKGEGFEVLAEDDDDIEMKEEEGESDGEPDDS